ncbi:MAG: hypothetical protein OK455_08250 [Thaumarchaeota archaeon]|nr:hypothetical protein [Nitrososphaerota archaeon]
MVSSRSSVFFAIACLFLLFTSANLAHAASLGQWNPTASYPLKISGDSCVAMSEEIYCMGGYDTNDKSYSNVYYAPLTSSGIGSWSTGASYPTAVDSSSCVGADARVYCVGGENGQTVLNNVYSSPVSSPGLGPWSGAAAYPLPIAATSCVASSGYIYCVGGFDNNGNEVDSTYYASLSNLNSWTSTTPYPTAVDSESCVAYSAYVYCVSGETENGGNPNNPINEVYYAQLSSSGIGAWSAASAYPVPLAALSCVQSSGDIYCVGGFDINLKSNGTAYSGQISSPGVSSWTIATPYPVAIDTSSCVTDTQYIYCVAGTSDLSKGSGSTLSSSYYAALQGSGTTTSSTTPEFPNAAMLPVILSVVLGVVSVLSIWTRKKTL